MIKVKLSDFIFQDYNTMTSDFGGENSSGIGNKKRTEKQR